MGTGTVNSLMRYKKSLETKHRDLDNQINQAYSQHMGDEQLKSMKLDKLSLKQKITEIEKELELR